MKSRSALVAYGTETGNAYDYAEELGRLLERIHFLTHVSKLDTIDTSFLKEFTIVIIVVSTTGQGDLPISARSFWKSLLRKKLSDTYLIDVQFSTFGLGDSSYPKFNWAARKLHKRLVQLGANEIYPRGEGDEQHEEGLDASFVPWSTDLRQHLLSRFPLSEGVEAIAETTLLEPKWKLSLLSSATNGIAEAALNGDHLEPSSTKGAPQTIYEPGSTSVHHGAFSNDIVSQNLDVTLRENRRMTPNTHWQDVRHLAFHCRSPASYGPGDVLSIFPQNIKNDIDQLLERMDWAEIADKPIMFTPTITKNQGSLYPSPPVLLSGKTTTLRLLLTNHLDLTAIPRRSFFALIAHFTKDPFQKDRLLEFTKPEYIDELYDYTTRPRRSILEVLQEFESVKIPWQWAANVFPELRGRQFSIASGGTLKEGSDGMARFELLVAIVKYKTVIRKIREGVCTRYLANLTVGSELRVALQRGSLAIKREETKRPVIMIGPGTGVAPMRSLAWERLQLLQDMEDPASIGSNLLFFGCRSKSADYFYGEEWGRLGAKMPLDVHAAFSRDQNHKIYVQDLIRQQSESVFSLLHENDGLVYVCGSSGKMPQAVRAALIDVFVERGMEQQAAKRYLEAMEKEGRYKQETW